MIDMTELQDDVDAVKYVLDFDKAYPYFLDHINSGTCTLASRVIERIDFKSGEFFTFLNGNARVDELYNLEGGIMPSYPTDNPKVRQVFTVQDLAFKFVKEFLSKDPMRTMIANQFIVERKDLDCEGIEVISYKDEVYYSLAADAPLDAINTAISRTDYLWYCFAVLIEGVELPTSSIKEEDIDKICHHLKYIVTSLYDGDAYLFWERK